jgi:type II secretory pathway pseudopilin PulG
MKQYAFTLSELLVSFSVLGLISAMTLPMVFNATNELKRRAVFKETYALLGTLTHEVVLHDSDPSSLQMLEKLKKKANVAKLCTGNVTSEGCWFVGQPVDNESTEAGFILNNGASVYGLHTLGISSGSDAVWIDVNGGDAPNALGQDMLKLHICYVDNPDCYSWTAPGYEGKQGIGTVSPGAVRASNLDALSFQDFMK